MLTPLQSRQFSYIFIYLLKSSIFLDTLLRFLTTDSRLLGVSEVAPPRDSCFALAQLWLCTCGVSRSLTHVFAIRRSRLPESKSLPTALYETGGLAQVESTLHFCDDSDIQFCPFVEYRCGFLVIYMSEKLHRCVSALRCTCPANLGESAVRDSRCSRREGSPGSYQKD